MLCCGVSAWGLQSRWTSVIWIWRFSSRRGSWVFLELSPLKPPSRGGRSQVRLHLASSQIYHHDKFLQNFFFNVFQPKPCPRAKSFCEALLGAQKIIVLYSFGLSDVWNFLCFYSCYCGMFISYTFSFTFLASTVF